MVTGADMKVRIHIQEMLGKNECGERTSGSNMSESPRSSKTQLYTGAHLMKQVCERSPNLIEGMMRRT